MTAKSSKSIWTWLALLLLLGGFAGFILYLDQRIADQGEPASTGAGGDDGTVAKPRIDFYEVLKDRDKRQAYDQLGANWRDGQNFRPPPGFDFGGFSAGGAGGQICAAT